MVASLLVLTLAVPAAAPSLSSDDPRQRLKAVEARAKTQAPIKLPKVSEQGQKLSCIQVRAPAEAACDQTAWLCVGERHEDVSSGATATTRYAIIAQTETAPDWEDLVDPDKGPILSYEEGIDPESAAMEACPAGVGVLEVPPGTSEEQKQKLLAAQQREGEKKFQKCLAAAKKKLEPSRVRVTCDLLAVNPCQNELFLRCSGKNAKKASTWLPKLGAVQRYSWEAGAGYDEQ